MAMMQVSEWVCGFHLYENSYRLLCAMCLLLAIVWNLMYEENLDKVCVMVPMQSKIDTPIYQFDTKR
jgi:hypothetical protein